MTISGWILMTLSCGSVTALLVFCYVRLFRIGRPPRRDANRGD
jgi:hypothetical protein